LIDVDDLAGGVVFEELEEVGGRGERLAEGRVGGGAEAQLDLEGGVVRVVVVELHFVAEKRRLRGKRGRGEIREIQEIKKYGK
jgi:hypothetical protein